MVSQSPQLTKTQIYWLVDLGKRSGGAKTFSSGWPTWEVLERHGLITIKPERDSINRYRATITDSGWSYLVPLGIRQRPEETA